MMSFAFILLCLAQIVHLGRHWLSLTQGLINRRKELRMYNAVNWRAPKPVKRYKGAVIRTLQY